MATRVERVPQAARRAFPRQYASTRGTGRLRRLFFALALVACALASLYAAMGLMVRVTPELFPGQTFPNPVARILPGSLSFEKPGENSVFNRRRNLLIVGLDARPGQRLLDLHHTDTIMVATLEPNSKSAAVLAFPRDLYITITLPEGTTYQDRINASYMQGVQRTNSFEGGIDQLRRDLKNNFGIEVDHWVILDFQGVERLIDALGGVDVNIPYDLRVPDWWYSNDDRNAQWVSFPSGPTHLDGYHAVAFGRYRNDSDTYRVKRQELVLQAAFSKALRGGIFDNPLGLWNAYRDAVQTDLTTAEILSLAPLLAQVRGDIATYSVADEVNGKPTVWGFTTPSGAAVLGWDPNNVEYWLRQVFSKTAYAGAIVEIWNGYGDGGFRRAEALGQYLEYGKGLPNVYLGPDVEVQQETMIVMFGTGREEMAEDIASWLGLPPTRIEARERTNAAQPDLVIVIGQDLVIPDS